MIRSILASTADVSAIIAAALTYKVVKYVLKRSLTRAPFGKRLHRVTRFDAQAGNALQRWLVGHFFEVLRAEAGVTQIRYPAEARELTGDPKQRNCVYDVLGTPRLLIADAADAHFILVERANDFLKADAVGFLYPLLGKHGLVTIIDENYHTEQRQSVGHAFGSNAMRGIAQTTMREHFAEMVAQLRRAPATAKGEPQRLDVVFEAATVKVISEAAFHTKEFAITTLGQRQVALADTANAAMALGPTLYNLLPNRRNRASQRFRRTLAPMLACAIEDVRRQPPVDEGSARSLLQLLAQNASLTQEEHLDHAITFLFAGHDTTATALMWFSYYMAVHPRVQEALHEELAAAFTADTTPSVSQLASLPYLDATLREVLRVRPPVPRVTRSSARDIVLPSGTFVPQGTFTIIAHYALHNDPEVYGNDVSEFRPERWLDDPELKDKVHARSWLPFGAGKRGCIGREFAMYELQLGAALMVRNFSIAHPADHPPVRTKQSIVTKPTKAIRFQVALR